jgi:ABC-type branched-subunit amino acid transport system ATPase component
MTAILACRGLEAGYGFVPVVGGVDIEVRRGEITLLAGPNGSGKTTTLMTMAGALRPLAGQVLWEGRATTAPMHRRCRNGLAVLLEGGSVTMSLTVRQNLEIAGVPQDTVVGHFPELRPHLDRRAGLLSGGQQQMLAVGRALARSPKVLLADELSGGLAPRVVSGLLSSLRRAADQGLAVLLVEQHVREALRIADRVHVMRRGRVEWSGPAEQALADPSLIRRSYLDMG